MKPHEETAPTASELAAQVSKELRPWEEAWTWYQDDPVMPSYEPGHSGAVCFPKGRMAIGYDPANYTRFEGQARGRLAAAAPDLARAARGGVGFARLLRVMRAAARRGPRWRLRDRRRVAKGGREMKPRRSVWPKDPRASELVTATPRRVRIVGHSEGAMVYVDGSEAKIGDEVRAGADIGIAVNATGTVVPPLRIDLEDL